MGKFMEGVLSSVAELDNNVRAARSKAGMVEKVQKGIWVWQAPLGYARLTPGGNLVIDEGLAPYIKLAFEEYSKGTHTFQSISDFLKKRGFLTRSGKNPCAQLMEKMLRNPIYCAKIRVWGKEYDGNFAPIIDEDLFMRCQPGARKRYVGKREKDNPDFPLRRFIVCPACGTSLTGSSSTGNKGVKYPYYHHHKQTCPHAGFIPKETLEQNFVEYLQEISPKLKYEKVFKAVVMEVWQSNYKKLDSENARARKEIEVLEAERQRVFDLHRAGKYTDQEFMDQKDLVNIKIQQKKILLDEKRVEEFSMEEALNYSFNFVRHSGQTWKELSDLPAMRMRFQNQAFPQKVTYDGKTFGTPEMSLIYAINQQSGADKSKVVTLRGIEPRFEA
ncbi:recombinase family protein [Candidatus Parcubacteria bacterium]|nr:recombinase family protein [Candidatus Parcubacteria bacterium]